MPPSVFREYSGIKIYACCLYDEIIKKLIKDFKYHNKKKLSSLCAELMFEYMKELNLDKDYMLIPVPISKERLKERKYNHMDLVADNLAELTGYSVNKNLLIRIKDTQKQFKLHKQERIKNIKGAFIVNENADLPKDTPLLIIDDITSTGITLEEIIKTLKNNGYKNITAVALSTPDIWN
jgi:ComF family protein